MSSDSSFRKRSPEQVVRRKDGHISKLFQANSRLQKRLEERTREKDHLATQLNQLRVFLRAASGSSRNGTEAREKLFLALSPPDSPSPKPPSSAAATPPRPRPRLGRSATAAQLTSTSTSSPSPANTNTTSTPTSTASSSTVSPTDPERPQAPLHLLSVDSLGHFWSEIELEFILSLVVALKTPRELREIRQHRQRIRGEKRKKNHHRRRRNSNAGLQPPRLRLLKNSESERRAQSVVRMRPAAAAAAAAAVPMESEPESEPEPEPGAIRGRRNRRNGTQRQRQRQRQSRRLRTLKKASGPSSSQVSSASPSSATSRSTRSPAASRLKFASLRKSRLILDLFLLLETEVKTFHAKIMKKLRTEVAGRETVKLNLNPEQSQQQQAANGGSDDSLRQFVHWFFLCQRRKFVTKVLFRKLFPKKTGRIADPDVGDDTVQWNEAILKRLLLADSIGVRVLETMVLLVHRGAVFDRTDKTAPLGRPFRSKTQIRLGIEYFVRNSKKDSVDAGDRNPNRDGQQQQRESGIVVSSVLSPCLICDDDGRVVKKTRVLVDGTYLDDVAMEIALNLRFEQMKKKRREEQRKREAEIGAVESVSESELPESLPQQAAVVTPAPRPRMLRGPPGRGRGRGMGMGRGRGRPLLGRAMSIARIVVGRGAYAPQSLMSKRDASYQRIREEKLRRMEEKLRLRGENLRKKEEALRLLEAELLPPPSPPLHIPSPLPLTPATPPSTPPLSLSLTPGIFEKQAEEEADGEERKERLANADADPDVAPAASDADPDPDSPSVSSDSHESRIEEKRERRRKREERRRKRYESQMRRASIVPYSVNSVVQEFMELDGRFASVSQKHFSISLQPENVPKNRYSDIRPYNHNIPMVKNHGYINASEMQLNGISYIAAQWPLKKGDISTQLAFWDMIFRASSRVIVCLQKPTDNDGKHPRYWPCEVDAVLRFGSYLVTAVSAEDKSTYTVYSLDVKKQKKFSGLMSALGLQKDPIQRRVFLFVYKLWPDHGIPEGFDTLKELITEADEANSHGQNGEEDPDDMQKSPMIGRTGVFVCCHNILSTANGKFLPKKMSSTLYECRKQRLGMIQTSGQYKYLWDFVYHHSNAGRKRRIRIQFLENSSVSGSLKGHSRRRRNSLHVPHEHRKSRHHHRHHHERCQSAIPDVLSLSEVSRSNDDADREEEGEKKDDSTVTENGDDEGSAAKIRKDSTQGETRDLPRRAHGRSQSEVPSFAKDEMSEDSGDSPQITQIKKAIRERRRSHEPRPRSRSWLGSKASSGSPQPLTKNLKELDDQSHEAEKSEETGGAQDAVSQVDVVSEGVDSIVAEPRPGEAVDTKTSGD